MNKIEVHLSHVTTGWIVLLGLMFWTNNKFYHICGYYKYGRIIG
jgi:hypothetical protein